MIELKQAGRRPGCARRCARPEEGARMSMHLRTLTLLLVAGLAAPLGALAQADHAAPPVTSASHSSAHPGAATRQGRARPSAQSEAGEPSRPIPPRPPPEAAGAAGTGAPAAGRGRLRPTTWHGRLRRQGSASGSRAPAGTAAGGKPHGHGPVGIGHGDRDRGPGTAQSHVYRSVEEVGYRRPFGQAHEQPAG